MFHGTTGWYGLLSAHFISPGEQLKDSGRNPMLTRAYGEAHTPAQWSTCWASRGCGAGAPGHRQSVRFICLLDACHVPGLWADLTRHVIALKICKSGESCSPDNKAAASLGCMMPDSPPLPPLPKGSKQMKTLETHRQQIVAQESGPCGGQSSAVQPSKQARVTQRSWAQGQLYVNPDPVISALRNLFG